MTKDVNKLPPPGGMSKAGLTALIGALAVGACQFMIFFYAPEEATMGMVQKIFYLHMPLAWWALFSFFVVFAASIFFLVKKNYRWDSLAGSAAELGLVFCTLALITGSIWARRSWGVWWDWDPRLTTTLIMWFIYAGYLIVRGLSLPRRRKASVAAVVGVVAFADVPLVFLSARLWNSLHPSVIASKGGGMTREMGYTTVACMVALGVFWLGVLLWRYRLALMAERLDILAASCKSNTRSQA